jgi:enamine deaminase RidA (YjgF/YER057c/UK114 family)
VYIKDARTQELPLVGGGEHDWAILLGQLGLLPRDQAIGGAVFLAGFLIYGVAIIAGWRTLVSDGGAPADRANAPADGRFPMTIAAWTACRSWGLAVVLPGLAASAAGAQQPSFLDPTDLPPSRGYTQVVEVPAGHRLVFLSGQVPLDSTGGLRGARDFRVQAVQVFENLRAGLRAVGADFENVVKLNFYILDVRNLPTLREVRDRYVSATAPPASTLVEVSRLFRDDVLLEVEAVAAVRDRRAGTGGEDR